MNLLFVNPAINGMNNEDFKNEKLEKFDFSSKLFFKKKRIDIKKPSNPYRRDLPIGLLTLAAYIDKIHHKIFIQDGGLCEKDFSKYCEKNDVLLVTSYSSNHLRALELLKFGKNNGLITVYGGPHATGSESLLNLGFIDLIVRGEGEATLKELVDSEFKNLEKIDGISFIKNGSLIRTKDRKPISLDEIPPPQYGLVNNKILKESNVYLETTRGCPNKCLFCAETNLFRGVRYRSPKKVNENIAQLLNYFEGDEFHICDPTFNSSTKRLEEIIPVLNRSGLHWAVNLSLKNLTEEQISLLKDTSITTAFIGIESGSDSVLKINKGGITFDEYLTKLKKIRFLPYIVSSWIFGLPGDTDDTIAESLKKQEKLLKENLVDYVSTKSFVIYPLTKPFENPKKYNLDILKENFIHYDRGGDHIMVVPNGLDSEKIINAINNANELNEKYGLKV